MNFFPFFYLPNNPTFLKKNIELNFTNLKPNPLPRKKCNPNPKKTLNFLNFSH